MLCAAALFFLYFFGLTRTGLLGPDEPRYAAIGRAMADTGDWITPRLWGQPWFEKPALLYWMTAAGFRVGLGSDLAPRLPVAIASVVFLLYFFVALRREFGSRASFYAAAILATSVGWLVYSHVAVTDLPMSAAFAAAMLVLLKDPLHGVPNRTSPLLAGVLLGVAVLAKGLVPLVLFLPAIFFLRSRLRELVLVAAAAAVVALPWYALATLRNGRPFLEEFFWKHHFQRFTSVTLQHEQPFWYYLPVLMAGLFPWAPLLFLLFDRRIYKNPAVMFLLSWSCWGVVFFSFSRNKLPGYLLPLLPPLAALLGVALNKAEAGAVKTKCVLAASAFLLWLIPPVLQFLPQALLVGASHTPFHFQSLWIVPALATASLCVLLEWGQHRTSAVALIALLMAVSVGALVWRVYPQLDVRVSARSAWLSSGESMTCVPESNRSLHYGLYYYAHRSLPDCN